MKKIKKLASALLPFYKADEMADILRDYTEFEEESDFDFDILTTLKSLDFKIHKLIGFILFLLAIFLVPLYTLYLSPYNFQMIYSVINILCISIPMIIAVFFGKKLVIINNFHKKGVAFVVFSTIIYVLINSAIFFMSLGNMADILIKLNSITEQYIQFFWQVYNIFLISIFILTIFITKKLFSSGISYYMLFCSSYLGVIYLFNFVLICGRLTDIEQFKNLVLIAFFQYITGIIISFISYFIILKKGGYNNEFTV